MEFVEIITKSIGSVFFASVYIASLIWISRYVSEVYNRQPVLVKVYKVSLVAACLFACTYTTAFIWSLS